ncbi:MAG: hypothetical protein Q8P50_07735 [Bacillota bacterium]|nr:hypothetical protein [Bacillota bacterium]
MRREVPLAIVFVTGAMILFEYFLQPLWKDSKIWAQMLQNWGTVVSGFAMGLAAMNLITVNLRRMDPKRNAEWYNPLLLLLGMVAMAGSGLFLGTRSAPWQFLFKNIFQPLGSAMFALMIFFIASAAQRAFRARNLEAIVLLVSGIIVMLGRAPIGELIGMWLPAWADWLVKVPSLAGNRAVMMGAALGMVATAFRALVGIDRAYLGGE